MEALSYSHSILAGACTQQARGYLAPVQTHADRSSPANATGISVARSHYLSYPSERPEWPKATKPTMPLDKRRAMQPSPASMMAKLRR
jgi:hypothetical protein